MKLFNNKKGIELSINFIVMLLLALAVFAGGLMFATKFFGKAEDFRGKLDAQTEKQIEKLLDSGSPVVIPISSKSIYRNEHGTFAIGVLAQFNAEYRLDVVFDSSVGKDKQSIDGVSPQDWLSGASVTQELQKFEKGKYLVLVNVPKGVPSGTYIYKATVYMTDANVTDLPYDNPVQMIVKVP